MSARVAGLDEVDLLQVFLSSRLAKQFEETDGRYRPEKHVGTAWALAEASYDPDYRSPVAADFMTPLYRLRDRVASHPFRYRGGVTDKTVSSWVLSYCLELGTFSPLLGSRMVAEETLIGQRTAKTSLRRLSAPGGLLTWIGKGTTGANHYRVNLEWLTGPDARPESLDDGSWSKGNQVGTPGVNYLVSSCPTVHPAFLPAALGKSAGVVFAGLRAGAPQTVSEVAKDLGMGRKTAERALTKLAAKGLVTAYDGYPARYAYNGAGADQLDVVAREMGTYDWQNRTRERHQDERDLHAELKAEWKAEQEAAVAKSRAEHDGRLSPEGNPFHPDFVRPPRPSPAVEDKDLSWLTPGRVTIEK